MNLEQLYFLAEIIAALAVIISIFYLAVQVRNSRIQNKKEIHLDMSKFRAELTLKVASDKDLSHIVAQGLSGETKMDPNDYFRFSNFAFSYFIGYEVAFHRNKSKDIDRDIAGGIEESLHWWLAFPGVQIFWKNNSEFGFSKDFKEHVNTLLRQPAEGNPEILKVQAEFMRRAGARPSAEGQDKNNASGIR